MISQNVFIVNYNSLYEILDEIKENLSFKITKFENEDDFRKNKNFDEKNILIISNATTTLQNLELSLVEQRHDLLLNHFSCHGAWEHAFKAILLELCKIFFIQQFTRAADNDWHKVLDLDIANLFNL